MTDVVGKLWGFCNVLRHDGMDYGDYIEQLTYLLFLKMADERGINLPTYTEVDQTTGAVEQISCDWPYLRKQSGTSLTAHYTKVLTQLGTEHGILGDIFASAQNRFTRPTNMSTLIRLIDDVEWTALEVDVKAAAFEGLLEKAAAEGKKGAGQYFTPRILIQAIVRCVQPDPRGIPDFTIADPACGTGGFLVAAYEWLKEKTEGGAMDRETVTRVLKNTYFGKELVERPRRLALMNMYLHLVEPHIDLGDSIYEVPSSRRFDVILTNPPFGNKGANQAPVRDDFLVQTSNKQLNFIQHVMTIMKRGGRAAMVVPDNVLFADQAAEVFRVLMEDCDLHTVLRCPRGTFSPYSDGTQTYVIFFTKGRPTERVWIYDARAGVPKVTKRMRPLAAAHFDAFERCFGGDANGQSPRAESDSVDGRWRVFSQDEVRRHHYELDSFKWLRDDETDDSDELADPEELITEAVGALRLALDDLSDMQRLIYEGNGDQVNFEQDLPTNHIAVAERSLGRLRQSLLSAACSGRLTADWRQDHDEPPPQVNVTAKKAPRRLRPLDSYTLDEIPDNWSWVQLEDLLPKGGIFDGPFGSNLKTADYTTTGARVVRLENIGNLHFIDSKQTFVSVEKYENLIKHAVYPGDIVFSSFVEEQIRVCVLPEDLPEMTLAKADCFTLRPDTAIYPPYLALQLASPTTYRNLGGDVHGATRPRVNTTQVRSLPVAICSLSEQREVVRRFEQLVSLVNRVVGREAT